MRIAEKRLLLGRPHKRPIFTAHGSGLPPVTVGLCASVEFLVFPQARCNIFFRDCDTGAWFLSTTPVLGKLSKFLCPYFFICNLANDHTLPNLGTFCSV